MVNWLRRAFQQLSYLFYEISLIINHRYWRWVTCWFGSSAGMIASYRLDRFFYLLVGETWTVIRIAFFPLFLIFRVLSASHEIHYRAQISRGLRILHGNLGIVVSGHAVIGQNLTLTGGNCIGERKPGEIVVGDNVSLGANAVILGPIRIGSHVQIGAGAVVVKDAEDHSILVGVPAHPILKDEKARINSIFSSEFSKTL
jgi:serine O-acetyltransferase